MPSNPPPPPSTPLALIVPGFNDRTVTIDAANGQGGVAHRFAVWLPPGFDATPRRSERWPIILFLHGRGECGTDGRRQTTVGLGPALNRAPSRWPFVVVMPQKPQTDSPWIDHERLALAALAAAEAEFAGDPARRYLTGLSQGGAGTWAIGGRNAHMFAAIAPVCGYGPTSAASGLARTPVWAFHGGADTIIPVARSNDLVEATRAAQRAADAQGPAGSARGEVTFTVYPRADHNSWDPAYAEELPAWFLRHRRPR